MQANVRSRHAKGTRTDRGSVLVLSLVILIVVAGFTAALLTVAVSSQTTATINAKRLTAQGLAEGAVEVGKQWVQTSWANQATAAIQAKAVTDPSQLSNAAAWTNVSVGGETARYALLSIPPNMNPAPLAASPVQVTPDGQGWWVDGTDGVRTFHYLYSVYGRAEYTPKLSAGDSKSVVAAMSKVVEAQVTPLFQYAVFYNSDLEILPGPNMTLTGRVHSNRDMYLGTGATLTFDTDYVRAVGKIYRKRKNDGTPSTGVVLVKNLANMNDGNPANDFMFRLPNGAVVSSKMFSKTEMASLGVNTPSGFDSTFGGFDTNANGTLTDTGDWKPWGTQSMSFWGGTVQSSDMDVPKAEPPQQNLSIDAYALTLGGDFVSDGLGGYVPVAAGSGTHKKGFFHQSAGLAIVNGVPKTPDGTNVAACLLAGTLSTAYVYDAREGMSVPQTKIDVEKLKLSMEQTGLGGAALAAQNALKGSWNGLVYATQSNATPSAVKGIHLVNGSELPNSPTGEKIGLTVATDLPIYIQGDYNTKVNGVASPTNDPAYRKPAAVIADAVNLLSNNWTGSKSAGSSLPTAGNTTFNTAMIAGNSDSIPGSLYNGGLENLPRFHENWSGKNAVIAGSFVNLWKSKIAKKPWVYGSPIYTAPNRIWDFDSNYKSYAKLPPFTPLAVDVTDVVTQ